MHLTILPQIPAALLTLTYLHEGVPLYLALLPDGTLARAAFLPDRSQGAIDQIVAGWQRRYPRTSFTPAPHGLSPDLTRGLLVGTAFQLKVWQALEQLPSGATVTYAMLAHSIGHPTAHRAVGSAVGANPLAPFIPCHRVLATSGKIGGFIGGPELKRQLLAAEGIAA